MASPVSLCEHYSLALRNPKHEKFCQLIARGYSGTKAYAEAGFNSKSEGAQAVMGCNLLKNAKILGRIRHLQEATSIASGVDRVAITAELAKIAFANPQDFIDIDAATGLADLKKLSRSKAAAISEITVEDGKVKIKLCDKNRALDILAKINVPMRMEHSGPEGAPIQTVDIAKLGYSAEEMRAMLEKLKKEGE